MLNRRDLLAIGAFAFVVIFPLFSQMSVSAQATTPEDTKFYNLPRVQDNMAVSPDGSIIRAFLRWEDFSHNDDRTIYPWESFTAGLQTRDPSGLYDKITAVMRPITTGGGGWIFGSRDISTSTWAFDLMRLTPPPDLYAVSFTLRPKPATVRVEAYYVYRPEAKPDEVQIVRRLFSPKEEVFLDNESMDWGGLGYVFQSTTSQGKHTLVFGGFSEDIGGATKTFVPPPPVNFWVLPGREYTFKAYWVENTSPPIIMNQVRGKGEDPNVYEAGKAIPPTATINICIVPYNPKFAVIPYLCLNKEEETPQFSYDLPHATLVRYDGNQFDPENENRRSLGQRAVVDTVSIKGNASWPLRATVRQLQLHDNYPADITGAYKIVADGGGRDISGSPGARFTIDNARGRYGVSYRTSAGVYAISCSPITHSGKRWYPPPDFYMVIYPGDDITIRARFSEKRGGGSYTITVHSGNASENRIFDNRPPYGPLDSYYRRDMSGNPLYYEPGDVVCNDSRVPKCRIAALSTADAWRFEDCLVFRLSAEYGVSENLREEVTIPWPGAPSPIGGLILRGSGGSLDRLVFGHNRRYYKFVFTLSDTSPALSTPIKNWIAHGMGTLALDVSLRWGDKTTIKTCAEWGPFGLVQPVAVCSWRLAPWARRLVNENAQVLYLDNAWMIDNAVSFEVKFVPVYDAENFMLLARISTENVAPALESFLEENFGLISSILENLGMNIRDFQNEIIPAARSALYSLSSMDNYMLNEMIKDIGWDNKEPQVISGKGRARAAVERRGIPVFAVEKRARVTGGNARAVSEITSLPFDNRDFEFNINLRGEGMAAELALDTSAGFELHVHAPPRSGGLQSVRIFDNENRLLFQQEFLLFSPMFPSTTQLFGASASENAPRTMAFQKTPATPTEIYVELTNQWGASKTVKLSILPWAPAGGPGVALWGWLIVAGIFIAAWTAFINKMRDRAN